MKRQVAALLFGEFDASMNIELLLLFQCLTKTHRETFDTIISKTYFLVSDLHRDEFKSTSICNHS